MPAAADGAAADPTPILYIHGLLGSSTNFRAVQAKSSRCGRHTLAVDLRDHGQSPHSAGASTLLDYARDVAAVIESKAAGGRADVVGHSLGGKTGMVLALMRPELVRRLVVVDISPTAYAAAGADAVIEWTGVSGVVHAVHKLDASAHRSRQSVDAELAKGGVADPGVRSFVCQNLVMDASGSYRWRMNSAALVASLQNFASFPADAELRTPFSGEVHVISGENSGYVRPHHQSRFTQLFPSVTIHPPVPGASHWVHADKPAEFWQLLSKSLHLRSAN